MRAVIVQPEVESRDLAGGTVGYIRLSGFSDHAAEEFDAAVASGGRGAARRSSSSTCAATPAGS